LPLEVIVELLTPTGTATFSYRQQQDVPAQRNQAIVKVPFLFGLEGTLHDVGQHVLHVSCNNEAHLDQTLEVIATSGNSAG